MDRLSSDERRQRLLIKAFGFLACLLVALLSLPGALPAREQTYCVRCSEPDATYNCAVSYGEGGRAAQSLQLYCIVNLARMGGHARCTAARNADGGCEGPRVALTYVGPQRPLAGAPSAAGGESKRGANAAPDSVASGRVPQGGVVPQGNKPRATIAGDEEATKTKKKGTEPPKTLIEATDRAIERSKSEIEKARKVVKTGTRTLGQKLREGWSKTKNAVGRAAKGTYDCITSLFSDC